ncbi:MAG: argininosuccinate synthase [Chloroflexi bacterium]|nr:argininosuccinate synthase [Chloroflexota bacterium]MYD47029.1 argininosuccinate synthase [Chloroflexota bacterium]
MASKKIVLAYSGGLDTSVAVPWLREQYDAEVITCTIDLGMVDLETIRQRAYAVGASQAVTVDGRETLVNEFLWPALRAGAIYEGQYPLATALGRPLIARYLADVAREHNADAVAHGCTGKGNDQVRIEVGVSTLAPGVELIAPIREWGMNREDEVEYARQRNLPIAPSNNKYSTDENLWGRSAEAGELEDPWNEPPEDAYEWTTSPAAAPDQPAYVEIRFEEGIPTSVDGETMAGVALIGHLNGLAGAHGIGRIDHLENRLVGIKSREVYESPAAVLLHAAHRALETMTLSREQSRFKERIAQEYAELVYNGLWYTAHRHDLDAYVDSTQRHVTGNVRLRLHKGSCVVVGRAADRPLYDYGLATYDRADEFDHTAAKGFIDIYGLPSRTQRRRQG